MFSFTHRPTLISYAASRTAHGRRAGVPVSASGFIASLVGSLAWPGLIVTIVLIFHRQFGRMLERLSRVRLGAGGEADPDWSRTEAVIRQSVVAARHPELTATGSPLAGPPGPDGAAARAHAAVAGRRPVAGAHRRAAALRPAVGLAQ